MKTESEITQFNPHTNTSVDQRVMTFGGGNAAQNMGRYGPGGPGSGGSPFLPNHM